MNEHDLRHSLHHALDDVPVREVPYERISAAGRRRRTMTVTGSAAAITAVLFAGTLLLSAPSTEPLYAGAGSPVASTDPVLSEPSLIPSPAISSRPSDQPAPPQPTGSPTTPGGYCPIKYPSGGGIGYVYPKALDDLGGTGAEGTPPSFRPDRAIICRYDHQDPLELAAARDLRGPEATALYTRLETTPTTSEYRLCAGRIDEIHVFFADGKGNVSGNMLHASDCDLWRGRTSTVWPKAVSAELRALVPVGAGI